MAETAEILVIDWSTRQISVPSTIISLGVESDKNTSRIYFQCPASYGEFDISTFGLRVNYAKYNSSNKLQSEDSYIVEDAVSDGDTITFSWLVGPKAYTAKGKTKFSVVAKLLDSDGNTTNQINTIPASLTVLEGLDTTESITEENADIIDQILVRIDNIDGGSTSSSGSTSTSTTEDPLAGKVVTCFGDSLMNGGQSSSDSVGFARVIKNKHPDATVYNYAVGGSVLSQTAYEINYENGVTRGKIVDAINTVLGDTSTYPGGANPDYIVISGLGNDYLTCENYGTNMQYLSDVFGTLNTGTLDYDSYDTVFEAIEYVLAKLGTAFPFSKIVFITPHSAHTSKHGPILYSINKAVALLCEKYGVTLFDMGQTMLGTAGVAVPYTEDGSLFIDSLHPSEAGYDYIADEFDECLITGISNNYYSRNYTDVPLTSAVTATSTYTAGYTYNNILFAYNLGSVIRVVDSAGIVFNMVYHDDSTFQFSGVVYNSKFYVVVLYISKSDNNTTFNAVVTTLGG